MEHFVTDDINEIFFVSGKEKMPAKGQHAGGVIRPANKAGAMLTHPTGNTNMRYPPHQKLPSPIATKNVLYRALIKGYDRRRKLSPRRIGISLGKSAAKPRC
ncbi:MAG: hypothetical protein ACFNUI_02525 [Negativicutes bacterium]